jgi:hypothetical protein
MPKARKSFRLADEAGPKHLTQMYHSDLRDRAVEDLPSIAAMINPEDHEPVRLPDDQVANSAKFKAPVIIDLPSAGEWNPATGESTNPAADGQGETVVALMPGTKASIWHTAGTLQVITTTIGGRQFNLAPVLQSFGGAVGSHYLSNPIRDGAFGVIPRLDNTGRAVYEVIVDNGGAGIEMSLDIYALNPNSEKTVGQVTIETKLNAGAPFVPVTFDFKGTSSIVVPILGVGSISFAVSIATDQTDTSNWVFGISSVYDPITMPGHPNVRLPANSCTNFVVRDYDRIADLDLTSVERTTALSGLITYMGSNLKNGGLIAAARLPMGESIVAAPNGDFFGHLAQLPTYVGDFPLRQGAYTWWLPDDPQEFFMRPHAAARSDDMRTNSSLWFVAKRDERDQVLRLRAVMHLETLTRSVQYTSEVHYPNPLWPTLLAMAKTLPAVTENNFHDWLSKAWHKFTGFVKNPKTWSTVAKAVMPALGF